MQWDANRVLRIGVRLFGLKWEGHVCMMNKYFMGCLVAVMTSTVSADVDESGKITRIIVEGNNHISVWLDGVDVTTECVGGGRWTLNSSKDSLFKEKASTLLAAASAGKTVLLRHISSWGCGTWNSNTIYLIQVTY